MERAFEHQILPGGAVILTVPSFGTVHVRSPLRLGDGVPADQVLPDILAILQAEWGPIESVEKGDEADADGPNWPRYWDWEVHHAGEYTVERRGEEHWVGAASYAEQILIGLMAAAGYDTIKYVAGRIAALLKTKAEVEDEPPAAAAMEVCRLQMVADFGAVEPVQIRELPLAEGLMRFEVLDASGTEYAVTAEKSGVVLWALVQS